MESGSRQPTDADSLNALTEKIIGCIFRVSNKLGVGFLEKVYENALAYEIRKLGYTVVQQQPIKVYYESILVGAYAADLVVEEEVIIELKVCEAIGELHVAQCLNYLKASRMKLCLLINFGTTKAEVRRLLQRTV